MDPNEILKAGSEIVKQHAPEVAAIVGAFKFTDFIKAMLGPATNEVAATVQDKVRLYRFGRQLEMLKKAEKMATDAGFTPKAVPIKLLLPLLEGASFEEDDDLHTMWAALLANASDPRAEDTVRPGFLAILKQLDVYEATHLTTMYDRVAAILPMYEEVDHISVMRHDAAFSYSAAKEDKHFNVTLEGLLAQRLIEIHTSHPANRAYESFVLTARGYEFIRACQQPPKVV